MAGSVHPRAPRLARTDAASTEPLPQVLPHNLLTMLDAPVPILVGVHGSYLDDVPPVRPCVTRAARRCLTAALQERRPHGVCFVDLDRNEVIVGREENGVRASVLHTLATVHCHAPPHAAATR